MKIKLFVNVLKLLILIQVAGTMVDRLGSEFERWQQQMLSLQTEMSRLDQNCALAAAFVTYLGCEAYDKRQLIVPEWLRLCQVDRFDVVAFLVQEVEQVSLGFSIVLNAI